MADPKFHQKSESKTLQELAEISGAVLRGDSDFEVLDVAPLDVAKKGDISFLDNVKYKEAFQTTKASA